VATLARRFLPLGIDEIVAEGGHDKRTHGAAVAGRANVFVHMQLNRSAFNR